MSTASPSPFQPSPEHRGVPRVRCSLPAAVVAPGDWPGAQVLDLSRTGVRLAVALEARDAGMADLPSIVEQLEDRLALKLVVDLHPERLGSLVRRALQVVRIGPVVPEEGHVELGCVLVPPLTEDDAVALGVPLPREGEPPDVARRRLGVHPPRVRQPEPQGAVAPTVGRDDEAEYVSLRRVPRAGLGRRVTKDFRVLVQGKGVRPVRPLHGRALELGEKGGVVCLRDDPLAPIVPPDLGIAERVLRFTRAYGSKLQLAIEGETRAAWAGRVRVETVGIMPEVPGRLLLGFSFLEALPTTARKSLGLV